MFKRKLYSPAQDFSATAFIETPLKSESTTEKSSIANAYEYCRALTYTYAKTFYFASYFLPKPKRDACYALYAFCRFADDLVDNAPVNEAGFSSAAHDIVNQWKTALNDVYFKKEAANPVMIAWTDVLEKFHIPKNLPEELIEGVLMDTYINRYETFDDLYNYCYKVASVVGLMTSEIFGYKNPDALPHAIDLGIAMQLTNIARDIGEDASLGRIYIPKEELERFKISEESILSHRFDNSFKNLLQFQIERSHTYYDSADKGIPYLDTDSRLTVQLMSTNYRRILGRIEKNNYDVFKKRASLSLIQKATAVPTSWFAVRENSMPSFKNAF
ncbi:MAG: phytoene/squalene synthase family protein [Bacteroidota bacterium]